MNKLSKISTAGGLAFALALGGVSAAYADDLAPAEIAPVTQTEEVASSQPEASTTAGSGSSIPAAGTTEQQTTPASLPEPPAASAPSLPTSEAGTPSPVSTVDPSLPTDKPVSSPSAPAENVSTGGQTVTPVPTKTKQLSWILPNGGTADNVTWDQPVYNKANVAALPCSTTFTVQYDDYPYTTKEDKARTDALDDDGFLRYGEDHGWAISWHFETFTSPACPIEIPYPGMTVVVVCGPDNDTAVPNVEWVAQYGPFVGGPWIDGKYKTVDGKRVIDGSAQIKAEFRKTYIWAGTGTLSASDFRRWQMYPGTAPFIHEDTATTCPVVDVPETPETPETPEVPATPATPSTGSEAAAPVAFHAVAAPEGKLAYTGGHDGTPALLFGALLVLIGSIALLARKIVRSSTPQYKRN